MKLHYGKVKDAMLRSAPHFFALGQMAHQLRSYQSYVMKLAQAAEGLGETRWVGRDVLVKAGEQEAVGSTADEGETYSERSGGSAEKMRIALQTPLDFAGDDAIYEKRVLRIPRLFLEVVWLKRWDVLPDDLEEEVAAHFHKLAPAAIDLHHLRPRTLGSALRGIVHALRPDRLLRDKIESSRRIDDDDWILPFVSYDVALAELKPLRGDDFLRLIQGLAEKTPRPLPADPEVTPETKRNPAGGAAI